MPVIQSRVNGLKINIPADARGVVSRFETKGGNELVFDARSLKQVTGGAQASSKPVTIASEAPDLT
jgi:hypothetical protein